MFARRVSSPGGQLGGPLGRQLSSSERGENQLPKSDTAALAVPIVPQHRRFVSRLLGARKKKLPFVTLQAIFMPVLFASSSIFDGDPSIFDESLTLQLSKLVMRPSATVAG